MEENNFWLYFFDIGKNYLRNIVIKNKISNFLLEFKSNPLV